MPRFSTGDTGSMVDSAFQRWTNEKAWDLRATVHSSSGFYDVDNVVRGASTLHPPELGLAGPVSGLRLLHLQCHLGTDSISWARLGAAVTGVDFSSEALRHAEHLASECGVSAQFLKADVQALPADLDAAFEVVVTTYGVTCWIDDLEGWASGIARCLVDGGRFVLVEFHPALELLHPNAISGSGSYFSETRPIPQHTTGTYTDPEARIEYDEYRYQHPVSDVVTALVRAGLVIQDFIEYPTCSFPLFGFDQRTKEGWVSANDAGRWPCMYAVTALRGEIRDAPYHPNASTCAKRPYGRNRL